MTKRLMSKVALISGASRGIGRAIAHRFAEEGAKLVLAYHQDRQAMDETLAGCRARGAEASAHAADLRQPRSAQQLCQAALSEHGRIDVLVNNAGVVKEALLVLLSDDELETMVSTNILGAVRLARQALKPMLRQRRGCVINLSSVLAQRPGRGNAVYAGTKGFIESFSRALAIEVGRKSVRIVAIAPGVIETEMSAAVRALAGDKLKAAIALRRFGRPEEIAALAAFVASDEASYINGAVIATDGCYIGCD